MDDAAELEVRPSVGLARETSSAASVAWADLFDLALIHDRRVGQMQVDFRNTTARILSILEPVFQHDHDYAGVISSMRKYLQVVDKLSSGGTRAVRDLIAY